MQRKKTHNLTRLFCRRRLSQASVSPRVWISAWMVICLLSFGNPDAFAADTKPTPKALEVIAPKTQTMVVNDGLDIAWTFSGDVQKVNVTWTPDGNHFYEFGVPLEHLPADDASEGCVDPGEFRGCVRTLVPDAVSSTFRVRVRDAEEGSCFGLSEANTVDSNVIVREPVTILDTLNPEIVSSGLLDSDKTAVLDGHPHFTWKQALPSEGPGESRAVLDVKDAVEAIEKVLKGEGEVLQALEDLQKSIRHLPSEVHSRREEWPDIHRTLEGALEVLRQQIRARDLGTQFLDGEAAGDGIRGIRFQADRLMLASRVLQRMEEASLAQDEHPIVEYFYGLGSVLLKIVVLNPSPKKYQIMPLNVYLPFEIIPDDIISTRDLKIGYDPTRKLYYAFNEHIELRPLESRLFEVSLEDIWKIPRKEIDAVLNRTQELLLVMQFTEHYEQALVMVNSIEQRLARMIVKQTDESVSREEHIRIYRDHVKLMKQIQEEVKSLEEIALYSGVLPPSRHLQFTTFEEEDKDPLSEKWVPALLIGIGSLGLGFYFLWFSVVRSKRVKKTPQPSEPVDEKEEKKAL